MDASAYSKSQYTRRRGSNWKTFSGARPNGVGGKQIEHG